MIFEIYKSKGPKSQPFRVRMKGDNGERLFDPYTSAEHARRAIATMLLRIHHGKYVVRDLTRKPKR